MGYQMHNAQTKPPTSINKGTGRAQTQREPLNKGQIAEFLNASIDELENGLANLRDSHGGVLDGVGLSAYLGIKFALESNIFILRRL